jgi:hypothetical protein
VLCEEVGAFYSTMNSLSLLDSHDIAMTVNLGEEMENKESLQIDYKLMKQSLLQLQTDNFPSTIL